MSLDARVKNHLRESGDRLTAPPPDLANVVVRGVGDDGLLEPSPWVWLPRH